MGYSSLQDRYIRLVGKVAHVWTRSSRGVRVVIVDYHQELDQILDLIERVGETASIAPLKGLASICRLLLRKVKSMNELSEAMQELMYTIITHMKLISRVLSQDPDISRRLTSNPHSYTLMWAVLADYQQVLHDLLADLEFLSRKSSIWHQTRTSAKLSNLKRRLMEGINNFQTQCVLLTAINTYTIVSLHVAGNASVIEEDNKDLKPDLLHGVLEEPKKTDKTVSTFNPLLGPPNHFQEFVDIFSEDEIRKKIQKYILDRPREYLDAARKIVKEHIRIPEPIPDVHPYNPVLNEMRPTEISTYLKSYHVVFIIDDSTSMVMADNFQSWNDGRWRQAEQSLGPITRFAFENDVKSVDIGFMHYKRTSPLRAVQGEQTALQIFGYAKPPQNLSKIQRTPTGAALSYYLGEALRELNSKVSDPDAYQKILPTDIILLTDGEADDDPKAVIAAARREMKNKMHNPNYIAIQIVQIGHSPLVKLKLQDLTTGEYGSMADVIPSDGTSLTSEKLQQIILGGNHPTVREKLKSQQ